jgi:hypothetical protein
MFGSILATLAIAERTRFLNKLETEEPLKSRIGEYYAAVGRSEFDGGDTKVAWSAAFVSKMVELAGGSVHFPYNIRHSEYIYRLIMNQRLNKGVFRGWNAHNVRLRLGDIVASNRQDAPPIKFNFAMAQDDYSSHCDIVTELPQDGMVFAIGGNVGDKIGRTKFSTVGGEWRNATNQNHRIFCVIRAVGWPGTAEPAPDFGGVRMELKP